MSANDTQVGGAHYKRFGIEPWDVIAVNDLDAFQAEISYYLFRWRTKNGLEDLRKAQHWLAKYIEVEELRAKLGPDGMKAAILSAALEKIVKRMKEAAVTAERR